MVFVDTFCNFLLWTRILLFLLIHFNWYSVHLGTRKLWKVWLSICLMNMSCVLGIITIFFCDVNNPFCNYCWEIGRYPFYKYVKLRMISYWSKLIMDKLSKFSDVMYTFCSVCIVPKTYSLLTILNLSLVEPSILIPWINFPVHTCQKLTHFWMISYYKNRHVCTKNCICI